MTPPALTDSPVSDQADLRPTAPAPPRPLTPRARRRSWNERPVRLWLALTVLLAAATLYFTVRDLRAALRERRLIEHGERVKAKLEMIDLYGRPGRLFTRDEIRKIRVRYTTKAGRTLVTDQELPPKSNATIEVGGTIELRIDPDDPEVLTSLTEPRPWLASLTVVAMMVPALALAAAIALWQRARVLAVWRDGEAVEATVVDWHRSGLAPRSVVVRFTIDDEQPDAGPEPTEQEDDDDGEVVEYRSAPTAPARRVFSTLWPLSAGAIGVGDTIHLVMPANDPDRAIPAAPYS
jgi:hypothetical protein